MRQPLHHALIRLERDDYRGGDRALVVRVVDEPVPTDDPEWFELRGIPISPVGDRRPERLLTVRVNALRERHESEGRGV